MRFATRREAGFTLMEVLAALTIFAMGVVSIISLFPITARIQSETIGDVMSQIVMRNAEVTLRTRPIPLWYLNNGGSPSTITGAYIASDASPTAVTYNNFGTYNASTATDVMELPKAAGGAYGWLDDDKGIYTLRDRAYPAVSTVGSHAYTWVPLVRRLRAPSSPPSSTTAISPGDLLREEWEVFVIVHRNQTTGVGYVKTTAGSPTLKVAGAAPNFLPFPNFLAGGIGMRILIERAGPGGTDLYTTVIAANANVVNDPGDDTITISDNVSSSFSSTRVYAPGQILSAAIEANAGDVVRFDLVGFENNPAAPDIIPGQQVLMNDGTIYNVTQIGVETKGVGASAKQISFFKIAGLILPDANNNKPNRVWFGAKGTAQLFRIEGAEVIQ